MAQDKLQSYRERFQDFTDHFSEQRRRQLEDLRFSNPADPQQWEDKVRQARLSANRATLTFDHTNQYINQVVNDARQNKPSIQVIPSNSGADVQTAQAIEGMIRQIEYASRANIAYDTAIDHAARCGIGWMRIVTEMVNPKLNEQDIRIKAVADPLSCMISPESVEPDGADAEDAFIQTTMSKRAFEKKYGTKYSQQSWDHSNNGGWFNDQSMRVCEHMKINVKKENRLAVVMPDGAREEHSEDSYWKKTAEIGFQPQVLAQYMAEQRTVDWCVMSGSDILDETVILSKWIPLIPLYGNIIWIDGKRYVCGLTRQLMDGQRAKNYERSAQIEMIAMQPKSPFILPFESVENFENEWAAANVSNKAYLPYNALDDSGRPLPAPIRLNAPQIPTAFVQGAQQASDDMQAAIGMYKSNLGAPSNATSGRAKMQDQREGDTATYHYVDNQHRMIEHAGRIIVNMIPGYYDTKREAQMLSISGEAKPIRVDPDQSSDHSADVPTINPGSGTYDVRIKAGPAYATQRQEASEALTDLVAKNPQLLPILGPTWARMQDWPDADKVAKLLLSMAPPQVQEIENDSTKLPPEAQGIVAGLKAQIEEMKNQLKEASQAADQNQAKVAQDHASNALNEQKNNIAWYQAETARITALKPPDPGMTPEQVQILVMQLMNNQVQSQPGNIAPDQQQAPMQQEPQMQPQADPAQIEQMQQPDPAMAGEPQQEQQQETTSPVMGDEPA